MSTPSPRCPFSAVHEKFALVTSTNRWSMKMNFEWLRVRCQLPRRQRPDPLGQQRVLPQPARHQFLGEPHREDDVRVQPDGRAQRSHQHARAELP